MKPLVMPYGESHPSIADDAFVAPQCSVIGDVEIGGQSTIWFGTVLRGDVMPIRIGARTSIQDNSVVHATGGWWPTTIGDDCTVGHAVVLHGCTVGNHVLVGMGTVILDEAKIGDNTIIGANSLVTARTEIPSGVLALGQPAKVIRELREEELASIRDSASIYVQKGAEYRKVDYSKL